MGAGDTIDDDAAASGLPPDTRPLVVSPARGRSRTGAVIAGIAIVAVVAIGVGTGAARGGDGDEAAGPRQSRSDAPAVPPSTVPATVNTATTMPPTTGMTTVPATDPTTVPSTAPHRPPTTTAPSSRSTGFVPPVLPPTPPTPPPTAWVDPRPEASSPTSSCSLQPDGAILATARVEWSDGFVDAASARYQDPGQHTLVTPRGWTFSFYVYGVPEGAIGDLTCHPTGYIGVSRWG
jgi:hypothetical protein